jgi:CBS domain-containing protein
MSPQTSTDQHAGRPQRDDAPTVEAVMHRGVLSCRPDTPIATVARMMVANRVHAVVVDGIRRDRGGMEHLVWGVVSDLDLVGRLDAEDALTATAGDMSATPAVVVAPEDGLSEAARVMHDYDVHHVLVVDTGSRRPVGVLSTLDIAAAIVLDRLR